MIHINIWLILHYIVYKPAKFFWQNIYFLVKIKNIKFCINLLFTFLLFFHQFCNHLVIIGYFKWRKANFTYLQCYVWSEKLQFWKKTEFCKCFPPYNGVNLLQVNQGFGVIGTNCSLPLNEDLLYFLIWKISFCLCFRQWLLMGGKENETGNEKFQTFSIIIIRSAFPINILG